MNDSRPTKFLLWCAGADRRLLDRVPATERTRQVGLGTLVLVPAVLALVSMSYALSTLTDAPAVYWGGGLLWAAIVFCFDRYVVSTLRKSESVAADLGSPIFLSRVLLAAFVGIVVAHPLVLLVFDRSIEQRLDRDERGVRRAMAIESTATIEELREEIAAREAGLERLAERRNRLQQTLTEEIDGIVTGRTTGIAGRGASAREKERQLVLAEEEFERMRTSVDEQVAGLRAEIGDLQAVDRSGAAAFSASRDYLARVEALAALATESRHVRWVQAFLILFFVFVDTLPILFKGMSARGPYDELLAAEELDSSLATSARTESLEGDALVARRARAREFHLDGGGYSSLDETGV